MFTLTETHLEAMFDLAGFNHSKDEMIFFGLRGCVPLSHDNGISESHEFDNKGVDFRHMRCAIGQWVPGSGFVAYPGSTVPHIDHVRAKIPKNGKGVNMMATCYLSRLGNTDHRYKKGVHGIKKKSGHTAFRNEMKLPIIRTGDDEDYDGEDRFVYELAFDNLHCAFKMNHNHPGYSSMGCQVVAGAPGTKSVPPSGEKGDWREFVRRAYARDQKRFCYALFDVGEAERTARLGAEKRRPTVRFGTTGELGEHLQKGLIALGHDIGDSGADGLIGFQTVSAIKEIQIKAFGSQNVDLVAGPMTAAEIGISWP